MPKKLTLLLHLLNLVLKPLSEQTKRQSNQLGAFPQHPSTHEHEAWHAYWKAQGEPWRTEPEINLQRQAELAQKRDIVPDIEQGVYPFGGVKLSRADVEWLLATHENGLGPVDWSDEGQRTRKGIDLRGADLSFVNLRNLPLAQIRGGLTLEERVKTTLDQHTMAAIFLKQADLQQAHLEGSSLGKAHLEKALLREANLESADLIEAYLTDADLLGAYLGQANFFHAHLERANLMATQGAQMKVNLLTEVFESVDFRSAWLENANLSGAQLSSAQFENTFLGGAHLLLTHLEGAHLSEANLEYADLSGAFLQKACLQGTHLENANLSGAYLEDVDIEGVTLNNEIHVGPRLVDIRWWNTNLSVVKWSQVKMLGDEYQARQKRDNGNTKDKETRLREYETAVRANRQLAVALQTQGLNEQGTRFAYRAQILQRHAFWFEMAQQRVKLRQRVQILGAWLFSWFLFLLAGYGYKPGRSLLAYLLVIAGFTALYLGLDSHLAWYEAVVVSMTAFHGRGFSPSTFSPSDPLSIASAFEAFVGLIIEVTFIATLTQRFFNR